MPLDEIPHENFLPTPLQVIMRMIP